MITLTASQISAACGCPVSRAAVWLPNLHSACELFSINTPARLAAFLAQIGHESMRLSRTRELWGPTPAQSRYEGRADLGNTRPGDGKRYMGRGLIQITGRANTAAARDGLAKFVSQVPDFEARPELLENPEWAALSAGWFWSVQKGLNALADAGSFETITRRINGGLNGYAERLALWEAAKKALA